MRGHSLMIFEYAAMVGIPVLLALTAVAYLVSLTAAYLPLAIVLMLALFTYGITSFIEIYAHRQPGTNRIALRTSVVEGFIGETEVREKGMRMLTFKVKRFDRGDRVLKEYTYNVAVDKFMSVLDGLLGIKDRIDPSLSMRYSCRMGICGSCGMVVNGKPALACETNAIAAAREGTVDVGPMEGHQLLKDLVPDFDDFFEKHKSVEPHLFRNNAIEKYNANRVYKQNMEQENKFLPSSFCIMCGLCMDACPVVNSNPNFIGPQALSQAYRYRNDNRDQMGGKRLDLIDTLEGVWGCEFIGACSEACPKGVDPALSIQLLKSDIMASGFLGKDDD